MARISDVYDISTKASLGGLRAATKAIRASGSAITNLGKRASAAGGKLVRATFNLKNLGKIAGGVTRGISLLARSFTVLATGGLLAVFGLLRGLPALFGGMRDAMEGATEGTGVAAENFDEMAEAADNASSSIANTADVAVESAAQIEGVFGAFGKVGEGFVQAQGRIFDQAEEVAENAIETAKMATKEMEKFEDAVGGASQSTTRFGKALDRIGNAWTKAKNLILKAIAKAITPALEKLADLMESPEFQEFVELLAEDLAEAAAKLGKWFIEKAIPAIQKFMKEVKSAGGPVEFLKQKWQELKNHVRGILRDITGNVRRRVKDIKRLFVQLERAIRERWQTLKENVLEILRGIARGAEIILSGITSAVAGVWNIFISAIENAINAAIDAINPFIVLFNAVARATGRGTLSTISHVHIPRLEKGGVFDQPTLAVVGDVPEAVVPLDRLGPIIRDALSDLALGTPMTVNINVATDPRGMTADQTGREVATSFIREMRARGIQLSSR